ncbi:uncharacterized protein C6orf201 homolog isoform X1 [Trachypithecus francoisi]|uniref:uncharacterized protein C6orf201 homolog isoform X1 n=1 Tax=Trachypithecus francoisi TaxID=54180 RepID=UPI00141A6D6A|nr:uncharacterized protein C6orf201 homolog isoform X1 [Trachypithecus francoisi]XP_033071988.1 uncharacterized protein C6orf201 homolog isoform X1 [Trachypithecus francoisi]
MRTASSSSSMMKFSLLDKCEKPKNYAQPEVLCHTFDMLSNLHKLLPNHLMETLYSYRSEEDKKKCMWVEVRHEFFSVSIHFILIQTASTLSRENPELSGLERILARHQLPKEINLTPKPNRIPLWKRKMINNVTDGWKKCHLLTRNTKEPPMSTIVVRWLQKNMQPTEDLKSVICRLSAFGPIQSVTVYGRQSAIVAFKDMTSACNAVSAFQSRTPGTMFQCSWQQRFMSKDKTYSKKCTQKTQPKEHKQETEKTANNS